MKGDEVDSFQYKKTRVAGVSTSVAAMHHTGSVPV